MSRLALSALLLASCAGTPEPRVDRALELTVLQPAYGAFLEDGPIEVVGVVSDAAATVLVEGVAVPVSGDGTFRTTLDFTGDYEVVDIKGGGDGLLDARVRVPVFAGKPPAETWPGAMPGRMTNAGLQRLGEGLGAQVDATDWADGLLGVIPPVETDLVTLTPKSVTHSPTQVVISGVQDGVRIGIQLKDVTITTDARFEVFGREQTGEVAVTYGTVEISLVGTPSVRESDGVVILEIDDTRTTIDFADPTILLDGSPLVGLGFLADLAGGLIEPGAEWLIDQVLGGIGGLAGEIELGGPFDFETEVGESTLAVQLREVGGDPEGLAFLLGMGIDAPVADTLPAVPTPSASTRVTEDGHLVLGVHEYLFDGLIGDQVDQALGGELDVGPFSSVLGNLVRQLPGGNFAPEGEWCVAIDPGQAKVVRLKDGIAPLGFFYLPDVTVDFGVDGGAGCETWLLANMALEIAIVPDGTEIGAEIGVGEGAILQYGAPREAWTETELLAGVTDLVGTLGDVAGGQLSFDLAELFADAGEQEGLAGSLPPVEPRILDSEPMSVEGMFAITAIVWGEGE